jgi:hypothetical protein
MKQSVTRTIFAGLAATLISATLFAGGVGELAPTRGSGNLVTREFDFEDFTELDVGYNFVVTVRQNPSYRVSVTTDDNIMESLLLEQRGNELRIGLPRGTRIDPTTVEIEVLTPELRSLSLSGSARGTIAMELDGGSFDADLSGSSNLSGRLAADRVFFSASGSSVIRLQGGATAMEADVSGSSSLSLFDFPVTRAEASASGASDIDVTVSEELRIDASGSSTIRYRGNPSTVESDTSGASEVRQE